MRFTLGHAGLIVTLLVIYAQTGCFGVLLLESWVLSWLVFPGFSVEVAGLRIHHIGMGLCGVHILRLDAKHLSPASVGHAAKAGLVLAELPVLF